MKLQYKTYEEAKESFTWSERWEVFDESQENLNITYECIDRHSEEKTAIRLKFDDGRREVYTFGGLSRLTSQFANMLERLGVDAGDRVAMILNPSVEYYVSFFGVLKRGAVAVPCYSLLGPEGLEYRLRESNSKMAIINRERADLVSPDLVSHLIAAEELRELIQSEDEHYKSSTSADTLAVMQFSSGTTGLPKQVLYNHAAISVTAVYTKFWIGLRDDDKYMCTSSPAWGHGIWYGNIGPMIFGNGIGAYSGKFIPEIFLEGLEEFEITNVSAIPRVYRMIMDCGKLDNYSLKLRHLSYTGSAMDREVTQYFLDKLGLYIHSNYGNTEAGPIVIDYAFDDYKPKLGSAGRPMLGTRLVALDENRRELPPGEIGEVAVWRKGRWSPLGDFGYFDEDGYFWPKGRSDDVIKSSGFRIGPFEIESVLEKHPAIERAAVVGSPHKERGEIVKAFIVANREPSEELKLDIQEFVKTRLSMHEYPKEIEFVKEVPETPDGKIKRRELKERERAKKLMAM
ncbi:MAG TPA: acyl--CoA ligase [Dehalococcoidia bacterium]|nr:acyl--CoA ligase [Dehalococcoidia bacterium]